MTNEEMDRVLCQLRLGGKADTIVVRAQQARAEGLAQSISWDCSSTMRSTADAAV